MNHCAEITHLCEVVRSECLLESSVFNFFVLNILRFGLREHRAMTDHIYYYRHYVAVPPDPRRLLSDAVLSSSVLAADRGLRDEAMADITNSGAGPSGGAGGLDDLGVDPNLDPELAMVSLLRQVIS